MCISIPGQILKFSDAKKKKAKIKLAENEMEVDLSLIDPKDAKIGSWVLVHAGMAIRVVDEQDAKETIELLSEMQRMVKE